MLTRDAVVRASLELGRQSGQDALTMRALAAKLGVSATSLYGLFEGKEAILRELRAGAFEGLANAMRPALDIGRRRERLSRLCLAYLGYAEVNPWLYSLAMEASADDAVDGGESPAASTSKIVLEALRTGAPEGASEATLQLQVVDLWASLHGVASLAASGQLAAGAERVGADPQSVQDRYVDALVDSLAVPGALRLV